MNEFINLYISRFNEFDQSTPSANSTPSDSSKPAQDYVAPPSTVANPAQAAQHAKDYQTAISQGRPAQEAQNTADRNLNQSNPVKGQYIKYDKKTGLGGGNAAIGGTSA